MPCPPTTNFTTLLNKQSVQQTKVTFIALLNRHIIYIGLFAFRRRHNNIIDFYYTLKIN